jgi:subfamily B ATP-binding cassette protein MsbA
MQDKILFFKNLVYEFFEKYLGPYKKAGAIVFLLIIITGLFDALSLGILLPLFNVATNREYRISFDNPFFSFSSLTYDDRLILISIAVLLTFFLRGLFTILREFCISFFTNGLIHYWSKSGLRGFLSDSLTVTQEKKIGHIHNAITNEPIYAAKSIRAFVDLLAILFSLISIFILLFYINFIITTYLLGIVISTSFLSFYISKKYSYNVGKKRIKIQKGISQVVSEAISGIRQIKVYSTEDKVLLDINLLYKNLTKLMQRYTIISNAPRIIGEYFIIILIVLGLCTSHFFLKLDLTLYIADISVFAMALLRISSMTSIIVSKRIEIITYITSLNLFYSKANDNFNYVKPIHLPNRKLNISIKNLGFSYTKKKPILTDINLDLNYGEITALSGSSGSGKTTFCDILVKLINPTIGNIFVNGVSLNLIDEIQWRGRIGYVSQDFYIFNGSVKDNIKIGFEKATDNDVIKAAIDSQAHDFITTLPHGYDSNVGTGGVGLSGGQKQRIALAQAFLKKPDLLILDEATNGLDYLTEQKIFEAIKNNFKDKIVLIITHRSETLRYADKIIYINKGRI